MRADDPELTAALASVAEGPGDEGRRRVLGDLLLERGDPRGEFLLVQFLIAENKGSGAIRQRADELWRSHKRAWMAGAGKLLTDVKLDRGFPVEAKLLAGVTPAILTAALGSPMLATLRRLTSASASEGALVEAIASPRLRELREVALSQREAFAEAAVRGVNARLTSVLLGFDLTPADCDLLLRSPVFSKVIRLSVRGSTTGDPARTSRWARILKPAKLSAMATTVERLSSHPSLKRLTVFGDAFGDHRRLAELAPLWPRLTLEQLVAPGSFELTREPEGTVLTLQNMSAQEMIGARPLVPAGTVRVLLMPRREWSDFSDGRQKLLKAFAGLNPQTLP